MKKILFYLCFCILFSVGVSADNNGVWHFAKDIRGGTFGQDESGVSNYTFINSVYLKSNTYTTNLYNSQNAFFNGKIGIKRNTARVELDVNGSIYADNLRVTNVTNTTILYSNLAQLENIQADVTNTEELYVNGSKVVTQGELLEKFIEYTNEDSVGGGVTTIYKCPIKQTVFLTYYCRSYNRHGACESYIDTHVVCPNTCTSDISMNPSCTWGYNPNPSRGTCSSSQTFICTPIGQIVPEKAGITLNSPSGIFASANHADSLSGSKVYKYTLPASFLNNVKIHRFDGILSISSSPNGGAGFDCRGKYIFYKVKNSGKVLQSKTISLSCAGTSMDIASVDFGGNLITDSNLEIEIFYGGGDDDEWVHYSANSFSFRITGDNGGVTTLNAN